MEQQENLLDELHEQYSLVPASGGKRFANYLIDLIFYIVFAIIFVSVYFMLDPDYANEVIMNDAYGRSNGNEFLWRIFFQFVYGLFLGLQETIFKGRTIGKFITGTRAVNENGSFISAKTAFLRGLSRAVPFCAFSGLGTPCSPWQDKWTDTIVIEEKKRVIV